jgi:hypothetical protein
VELDPKFRKTLVRLSYASYRDVSGGATYVAQRHFDGGMYRLVSGLYAFASAILFLRFCSAAYQAFHYKNLLIARGFEPWPVPNIVSVVIGGGTLLFLFAGTLGTLWFVRSTWKRGGATKMLKDDL